MDYLHTLTTQLAKNLLSGRINSKGADQAVTRIRQETNNIADRWDKSRFLQGLLEHNEQIYQAHLKECTNPEDCPTNKAHERVHFDLTQDLKRLGYTPAASDAFTESEAVAADSKVDQIIERLDELRQTQTQHSAALELLFEEMQELKSMHYLGKKTWRAVLVGKITEMVAGGLVAEATAKPLIAAATASL